jgi:hypothetical protein
VLHGNAQDLLSTPEIQNAYLGGSPDEWTI